MHSAIIRKWGRSSPVAGIPVRYSGKSHRYIQGGSHLIPVLVDEDVVTVRGREEVVWGDEAARASQLPGRLKPVLVPAHDEGELPDLSERLTLLTWWRRCDPQPSGSRPHPQLYLY